MSKNIKITIACILIILAALIIFYLLVLIRLCIKALFSPNNSSTKSAPLNPVWEKTPDENGELVYKFTGFSEFDSKSKYLTIDKIPALKDFEIDCYQIILKNTKLHENIIALAKLPLKQYLVITDENKLIRGWKEKMETIIIDYTILDQNYNPIAAVQFKRYTDFDKIIEDVFYNIRVPVFWIDTNKNKYSSQIPRIFQKLHEYFIQAKKIANK